MPDSGLANPKPRSIGTPKARLFGSRFVVWDCIPDTFSILKSRFFILLQYFYYETRVFLFLHLPRHCISGLSRCMALFTACFSLVFDERHDTGLGNDRLYNMYYDNA